MEVTAAGPTLPRRWSRGAVLAAVAIFVVGVAWAKWFPYAAKVHALAGTRTWEGTSLLGSGGAVPGWAAAWDFALAYGAAVWRALLVSVLLGAAIEALVPRDWLVRMLRREGRWRQAVAGGVASTPTMMCTCCTAPLVVSMRRSGVPLPAAVAYWLGNPLLNPAVVVFLFLATPWQWGVTRICLGVVLVVGLSALASTTAGRRGASLPQAAPAQARSAVPPTGRGPVRRYLTALARFALVLVPEYVVVVLLVGAVSGWLARYGDRVQQWGVLGVVLAAVVATALVIPTGGEIPVLVALSAVGAGAGLLGVLLVALPAVSLPSLVMVGRSLGMRVSVLVAGGVAGGALLGGVLLTALT